MRLMPPLRPLVGFMTLLSLVAGTTRGTPGSSVLLASDAPDLVLNLRVTISDSLSITSRRALMAEAESIWKRVHVRLNWLRESTEAEDGPTLRVLVVARPVPRTTEYSPWTVAELWRSGGSVTTAIASTIGARRIIEEGRRELLQEPQGLEEYRLGLVLGRAVSHEIGHYL